MALGEKLLQLRKSKGLSQEQLATQITVSRQAISKWELGEAMPDTDNIVQLSKIFGVSTDYLLNDDYEKDTNESGEQESTVVNVQNPKQSTQKIVGLILLCVGLIALVFMLIFSDSLAALIVSIPLIVCGVICLTVKKHVIVSCCWTVYILFYTFFAFVTGSGFLWIFQAPGKRTGLMALPLVLLIAVTGRLIYKNRKNK